MGLRKLIATIAATAILLPACAPDDQAELRGSLYFAAGNYLALLDLRDGSTAVETNLGDVQIHSISPHRDNRILVSLVGSENDLATRRLVLYDIETRQTLTLLKGREGHYLPRTKALVYDDGIRIKVTERVKGSWRTTDVVKHRFNEPVGILPLGPSRFIYQVGDGPPRLFDYGAQRSTDLAEFAAQCRLDRALWFADRELMLCGSRRGEEGYAYAFVGLDGAVGERLPLPASHDLRPLAYLGDQDVLILTERWQGGLGKRWKWAVWVFRFDSGTAYRLLEDQFLGDTVIYAPD
ncbi:MAG: hypothetical protein KJP08_09755 [Gammaproteobacteria bacterium]|nr:hypothetical protein [Gammaproteobacteria bacterium]MBT8105395.1 hypothetical protein [Gammaproteobacteria bacterium]NNF50097.1 hypothetical protein [Woeseiaceae bacterium]NNK25409.1 hypothetical protein [Woeseiaceae bacterium]NNL63232.1 hypothetical protein [Woeseiaceae bacterium]